MQTIFAKFSTRSSMEDVNMQKAMEGVLHQITNAFVNVSC